VAHARPVPNSASVVIVGGGVIGCSCAFHLAEAGVSDVVLVERDQLASGSTSKAAGGVRAQFSDSLNIQLGLRSLGAFTEFGERPGGEIDFSQVGYLFVLTREEDVSVFEASVALQQELGVPSRMIGPAEVKRLSPLVNVDDVIAGAFSPSDGHATPEAVVHGYAAGARKHGVAIETSCEVVDIVVEDGRIVAVVTARGVIETSVVICAAGAWSRECANLAGVDLPVTPVRRQVLVTEPIQDLSRSTPMTIDFATGFYFHREGQGVLMGMPGDDEPGFSLETTDDWISGLIEVAERRAPSLASVGIQSGWAGLYEMSPDHNALIGESSDISRFLYATGFSGHGFLQAPAVGEVVRDLVRGRRPFVDIAPLSVERFALETARPEYNII
jgi:sarcosine oxidase, subunit beta